MKRKKKQNKKKESKKIAHQNTETKRFLAIMQINKH